MKAKLKVRLFLEKKQDNIAVGCVTANFCGSGGDQCVSPYPGYPTSMDTLPHGYPTSKYPTLWIRLALDTLAPGSPTPNTLPLDTELLDILHPGYPMPLNTLSLMPLLDTLPILDTLPHLDTLPQWVPYSLRYPTPRIPDPPEGTWD